MAGDSLYDCSQPSTLAQPEPPRVYRGQGAPMLSFFAKDDEMGAVMRLATRCVFRQQASGEPGIRRWVDEFAPNFRTVFRHFNVRELWQMTPERLVARVGIYRALPAACRNGTCDCTDGGITVIEGNKTPLSFLDFVLYWVVDYIVLWKEPRDLLVFPKETLAAEGLRTAITKARLGGIGIPEERIIAPASADDIETTRADDAPYIPPTVCYRIRFPSSLPDKYVPQTRTEIEIEKEIAAAMLAGLRAKGYAWTRTEDEIGTGSRWVHWFYDQLIAAVRTDPFFAALETHLPSVES